MLKKSISILIIDDDEIDKQVIIRAISNSSYHAEISNSCNLESAMLLAKNNSYDCIFLDYSLPGSTGFDFLDWYKNNTGTSPVIMITSIGNEQLAVEAMKRGACDYIPKKNITSDAILQSLRYAIKINEVTSNTARIEKALIESEKKLETVISNSPLIFFSLDKQGIFTLFKGNATRTIHQSAKEIIGKSIFDTGNLLPVQLNDYLSACLGAQTRFISKVNDIHFEVFYIPVTDHANNLTEMMGVATDITVMKHTEEELIKAVTISEETSKIKEQFLANMSHEIRTPVHGIMSLADILSKTTLTDEQATYLSAVKKSADNLLVIINDILDLSKIESGKMTFENTPFNFNEVIQLTYELFRHKASEKNLDFSVNINDNIMPVLKGDPVRLSQIINNLISNSIKFTEKGSVRFDVKMIEKNEKSCVVNFKVTDTGIGIPSKKLSSIFDSFTQAGDEITRKYGGTGLGLSIVKKLTELQGGFISVESELNKGTTFNINLPFNYAASAERSSSAKISDPQNKQLSEKLKVLVVEDNEINQMIINKLLKDWGVTIDNANNGLEAIEMIKQTDYHVVLMDIEMPKMNGYEATMQIRKHLPEPKNKIPILAMTAHASHKEKEKCFTSGMNDYVSKPFDPEVIRNKIIQLTNFKESKSIVASFNENPKTEIENNTDLNSNRRYTNLNFLREMSDDNDEFVKDFITLFLKNAPESVAALRQHFQNKEWEQLRQVAHKIKPSLNYLGLKELHATAAKIEDYSRQEINLDELGTLIDKIANVCNVVYKELESEKKQITIN